MGRHASIRWSEKDAAWTSQCGAAWVDGSGRRRRREVLFRFPRAQRVRALAAQAAYLQARDKVEADPESGQTVEDVVQAWLQWSERSRDPRTFRGHREVARVWFRYAPASVGQPMRGRLAASVVAADLQGLRDLMVSEGRSPHYVARVVRGVKACWAWAAAPDRNRVPERLLASDPLAGVKAPRIPRSPERYAEWSEVLRFFRFCWGRARRKKGTGQVRRLDRLQVWLMRFVAMTGVRPDEAARLTWGQIDWDRGEATLRSKTTARTGRDRVIFLCPRVVRMLRAIGRLPGRHPEFVFTHKRGRGGVGAGADATAGVPWGHSSLSHRVTELRDEAIAAGVPLLGGGPNAFTLYRLRHTKISDDLMRGGEVAVVAAIHNTSPRMIEQVYGHLLNGHLRAVATDLAARRHRRGDGG